MAKLVHQMANLTVSSLPAISMPVAEAARAAFAPNGPFTAMSEPAILLGEAGVISANGAGREIADDKHATAELADIGKLARSTKAGERRILASTFRGRDALFEFDIAPWRDKLSLALGRDVTVVTGIREALQLSRERYRSLLAMAVDCIWEAGADGALDLLAPNNVFGRSTATLIGMPAHQLITTKTPGFHKAHLPGCWVSAAINGADGQMVLGFAIVEAIQDPETDQLSGYRGCFRRTSPATLPR